MTVSMQGQTLADINDYNLIYDIFATMQKGVESTYKNMLSNPDCLVHHNRNGERVGSAIFSTAAPENADVALDKRPITISEFISFLSGSPSYIDTAITGTVTIDLYLAPASHVLYDAYDLLDGGGAANGGPGGANVTEYPPTYILNNIYMTISKCTIDDGVYFQSVASALQSGMAWTFLFNHYQATTGTLCNKNTSMRYEVSGKSIDMALFTFYHNDRANTTTMRKTFDTELEPNNSVSTRIASNAGNIGIFGSRYFIRNGDNIDRVSFQVNGERLPMYDMTLADCCQNLLIDFGTNNDLLGGVYDGMNSSYMNWYKNFFLASCRLNHLSADTDKWVSGFDTSGTPLVLQVDVSATDPNNLGNVFLPWLCVSSSRVVKVYAGRQIVLEK